VCERKLNTERYKPVCIYCIRPLSQDLYLIRLVSDLFSPVYSGTTHFYIIHERGETGGK